MNNGLTLVVEDDRVNRSGLVRLLQYSGILVESAATIAEALDKLKLRPSIILLDLHLPDGVGTRVLEQVQTMTPRPKVCVLTGSATSETLSQVREMGPDEIMLKPVHYEPLLEWVKSAQNGG